MYNLDKQIYPAPYTTNLNPAECHRESGNDEDLAAGSELHELPFGLIGPIGNLSRWDLTLDDIDNYDAYVNNIETDRAEIVDAAHGSSNKVSTEESVPPVVVIDGEIPDDSEDNAETLGDAAKDGDREDYSDLLLSHAHLEDDELWKRTLQWENKSLIGQFMVGKLLTVLRERHSYASKRGKEMENFGAVLKKFAKESGLSKNTLYNRIEFFESAVQRDTGFLLARITDEHWAKWGLKADEGKVGDPDAAAERAEADKHANEILQHIEETKKQLVAAKRAQREKNLTPSVTLRLEKVSRPERAEVLNITKALSVTYGPEKFSKLVIAFLKDLYAEAA